MVQAVEVVVVAREAEMEEMEEAGAATVAARSDAALFRGWVRSMSLREPLENSRGVGGARL